MPVVRRKPDAPELGRYEPLIADLAAELTKSDGAGQPLVEEAELPRAGMFEVNVFWDRWHGVPDRDRPAIIQQAYRRTRSADVEKLAFAAGYTMPEAAEAGLLDSYLTLSHAAAVGARAGDYRAALVAAGGSMLSDPMRPHIWFPSSDLAAAQRRSMIERFPGSEADWEWGQVMRFRTVTAVG